MTRKTSTLILKIYALVSCGLILFLAYYFANHSTPLSPPNKYHNQKFPIIGYVTYVEGDVRQRMAGELLWLPSKSNTPVRDSDSIFTGRDGKIQIHLLQNTTLQVAKDSLIRVSQRNRLNTIHLEEGEFQISSNSEDKAVLQVQDRTRLLKLTGVDEKVTYQQERQGQQLRHLLASQEPSENFLDTRNNSLDVDQKESQSVTPSVDDESRKAAPAQQSVTVNEETTKSFFLWLAIGYGLFSLVAVKEVFTLKS